MAVADFKKGQGSTSLPREEGCGEQPEWRPCFLHSLQPEEEEEVEVEKKKNKEEERLKTPCTKGLEGLNFLKMSDLG